MNRTTARTFLLAITFLFVASAVAMVAAAPLAHQHPTRWVWFALACAVGSFARRSSLREVRA